MEFFLLRPQHGQSLFMDLKGPHNSDKKASELFADGPVEILFCRANDEKIVLSIKAPSELDIFLYDASHGE